MDPIELSNFAGLGAIGLLTLNILIGLLLAIKYNPVRRWPHRRINTVMLHNYTGWTALALVLVHPALLLLPSRVDFSVIDLFYPVNAPKQPIVNTFGAGAAYLLLIVVCIVAAIHNPGGSTGRRVYGVLAFVACAIGLAIAGRHTWLQHLPPDQVPECGPGLNYMVQTFPIGDVLRRVFTGSGECAKVDWTFLGLSMPEWNLFWFGFFAISALYYGFRRYRA